MDILPNMSRSKGNQTMKLIQLIEYNNRKREAGRLVQTSFCFIKKLKYVNQAVCTLVLIYFDIP